MTRRRSAKNSDNTNTNNNNQNDTKKNDTATSVKNQSSNHKNQLKRMVIDASQAEETRVAVLQGGRIEDFDIESLVRRQIKGNVYLAKVTRVEPSLQAAFVNYGGNRHGFLPFSEIHPDYYRIPVADRERLMAEQEELERKAAEEAERIARQEDELAEQSSESETPTMDGDDNIIEVDDDEETVIEVGADAAQSLETTVESDEDGEDDILAHDDVVAEADDETTDGDDSTETDNDGENGQRNNGRRRNNGRGRYRNRRGNNNKRHASARHNSDQVHDDEEDEFSTVEPFWKRIRRAYKIQEVIKRGQIMLIQIAKEERGNKGAAVTTYITLPGRYCVLMPNSPQSGGVSRKIANFKDRKRMREILKDLNVPDGMSVILRTAGTSRTKVEIKRDLDYLMRLWNSIRDLTLKSSAPAIINEEGSLIKRAIRDIYNKDIDEIVVSGEEGYKAARDMMKMLMPSHVKKVKQYTGNTPLFIAENIESQIEAIHSQTVHLKSGGYLVINPTEALVSVDVNSGRATRERHIEDTAVKTNMEAAAEVARQLRLRDLGGLVVIDFIDMENRKYNARVERALRDALSGDRARIQMGKISSFGLMELSRQRLHPSLTETHFETCPHCRGMGIVKTVDTAALAVLRGIEESGIKSQSCIFTVTVPERVAMYLFNQKRKHIADLEARYDLDIVVAIGHVEDEKGFAITIEKKVIENDLDDEEDNGDDHEVTEKKSSQPVAANETDSDKDGNGEESRNGRRRSRRGGRNRSNQNRTVDSKADSAAADKAEETATPVAEVKEQAEPQTEKPVEKEAEASEIAEKPAKAPRKSARKVKADKAETLSEETTAPVAAVEAEVTTAPTNDNADKKPAKEVQAEKVEDVKPAVKDYEKVNEMPKAKKKGWWQKIVEN